MVRISHPVCRRSVKSLVNSVPGFPQSDHNAAFRHHAGGHGLALAQHFEAASISRLGADNRIEPFHGFEVMVQHLRFGGQDGTQGRGIALEIGDEHFDERLRILIADSPNGCGKMPGAAIGKIVTGDRGDDAVAEPQGMDCFGNARGLLRIGRALRSMADGAEAAVAAASIPQ